MLAACLTLLALPAAGHAIYRVYATVPLSHGMDAGPNGDVFVGDSFQDRVLQLDRDGHVARVIAPPRYSDGQVDLAEMAYHADKRVVLGLPGDAEDAVRRRAARHGGGVMTHEDRGDGTAACAVGTQMGRSKESRTSRDPSGWVREQWVPLGPARPVGSAADAQGPDPCRVNTSYRRFWVEPSLWYVRAGDHQAFMDDLARMRESAVARKPSPALGLGPAASAPVRRKEKRRRRRPQLPLLAVSLMHGKHQPSPGG